MFSRYYQQELAYLRELAVEFSRAHPALAPSLSGQTTDPDVERLLEGVAFSTGLLRQKLDDEVPEVIHGLTDLVFPHYLRPAPSASVVAFTPKPALKERMTVERGTAVASTPVEGTSCTFRTCFDVDVHPLRLTNAVIAAETARSVSIRLDFSLTGLALSAWRPDRLRLFLGGDYPSAADRHLLLHRYVKAVRVAAAQGGRPLTLGPDALRPAGFAEDEFLIPYPGHSFTGYRLLQEYFLLPRKFLFMDITGLDRWRDRGGGTDFSVTFEIGDPPFFPRDIAPEHFVLFAAPVINIFDHSADPIALDHRLAEYPVRPSGKNEAHYQVFSVEGVTGIVQGSVKKKAYRPLEAFGTGDEEVYQTVRRPSVIDNRSRTFLTLPYGRDSGEPVRETLSLDLLCTNGDLAENLQLGDIRMPTASSPVLLDFRNITPVTASVQPPLGDNALWRLLSHLSLNYLPLADAASLRELLYLYIFPDSRDQARIAANRKRVEGVEGMAVAPEERLVGVHMMRGRRIRADLRQDHFASPGDMVLFGSVLDRFLSVYASMNSFTRFSVRDVVKGDDYKWSPRIGGRPLL